MFDAIAGRYDLLNHVLSAGIDRRWRTRAIRSLQLTGGERMLDLCTGTGDLAIAAVRARRPRARVVGVDFSGAMLRVGQRKAAKERLDARITMVQGDATRIPLARRVGRRRRPSEFGIRNVEDMDAACAELYRVMKPGGRLAILEFAVPTLPGVRRGYRLVLSTGCCRALAAPCRGTTRPTPTCRRRSARLPRRMSL